VCCVRFSNDGQLLATGCNRTAQIYDTKTGQKTQYVLLLNLQINADDLVASSSTRPHHRQAISTSAAYVSVRTANSSQQARKTVKSE
jgi:WD40 repeat protein